METTIKKPSVFTAMGAVFKKEFKIAFRYPTWFISMLIWPILLPLGYVFTAKALSGTDTSSLVSFATLTGTSDYKTYMLIGTVMWSWMNSILWSFGTSLRVEQVRGTLESNWLCPVPKISLLLGYSLFDMIFSIIYIPIIVLEFKLVYNFHFVGSPLLALLVLLVSIATLNMICGSEFPVTVLPKGILAVSLIIPLTYGYDSIRGILLGTKTLLPIHIEQLILVLFMGISIYLGIFILNKVEKYCKTIGNIGFH